MLQLRYIGLSMVAALIAMQQLEAQTSLDAEIVHLQNPDSPSANQAAKTLGQMGGDASPAFAHLVRAIRSSRSLDLQETGVWAVGRIAEQAGGKLNYIDIQDAAPYAIQGLRAKERRLSFRQACAYALGRLAGPMRKNRPVGDADGLEEDAVGTLIDALDNTTLEDDLKRQEFGRTVAEALGRFHPTSPSAAQVISVHLIVITSRLQDAGIDKGSQNKLEDFEIELAGALSQMGSAAKPAILRLRAMLQSKDLRAQQAAAYALRNIGPAANQAAPELITSVTNEDANVRQVAAFALSRIRPQGQDATRAVSVLAAALGDIDPGVREAAAAALGEFGAKEAQAALPELTASLEDSDSYVGAAAAKSLGAIANKIDESPRQLGRRALPHLKAAALALRKTATPSDDQFSARREMLTTRLNQPSGISTDRCS